MTDVQPTQVVYTNKARCRDCYRCMRVCPVKAISMHDGQAYVMAERCIACGTCIRECPQGAKAVRNDIDRASRLLESRKRVAISVAPSFAAVYPEWQHKRIPSALRRLGFCYVGETAIGAWHVANQTKDLIGKQASQSVITSACPSIVRYVETYRPKLVSRLVPFASPMIAHARLVRQKLGADIGFVFVGPCAAKKGEADRQEHIGLIDCVLTFNELEEWFERQQISLSECEESDFDENPIGNSRLFPLEGGGLKTAAMSTDLFDKNIIAVSGFEMVAEAIDLASSDDGQYIIEPLMCKQGCVNGPCSGCTLNGFARKESVLEYAKKYLGSEPIEKKSVNLRVEFSPLPDDMKEVSEDEIRHVLQMMGKVNEEDQLNCGGCGYPSCREKAIAVVRGLAQPDMCISFMRRLAEQRTDKIIETSPNGIVILDEQLRILHMNPAFRKFFVCSNTTLGKPISLLMDPQPFARLASGQEQLIRTTEEHPKYNLICHQILYSLLEDKQYVGLFVDITAQRTNLRKLKALREKTVQQARELLEHQLRMSEDIARCLGENTARSEDLLEKLTDLAATRDNGVLENEEDE